jgi:hypothetical protein
MPDTIPAPAALAAPLPGSVSEDYGVQKIGFWLAVATLVALSAVMGVLLLRSVPLPVQMPPISASTTPDQVQLFERWAKVQTEYEKSAVERTVQIGQLFVTGTLLPVLTALLGYIFGKRDEDSSEP